MYHRNKVHTDEFWKYELAKHRRTVMDSKTNEDMWKKQLGKHADEFPPQEGQDMDKWLEAIKKNTASDAGQNSQVSAEMKFLALQSLQSMMNMNSSRPSTPPESIRSPPKAETPAAAGTGYLNLLAHLSAQRKAETEPSSDMSRFRQTSESSSSASGPAYLPEMKEECAAKRTQMWLAQLGRYRQNSVQDEMDKNHDELWEEQIAKVKSKPVKSPLEPIEITINEDEVIEEVKNRMEAAALPPPPAPPSTFQKPSRMVPLMSALQCQPRRRSSSAARSAASRSPSPICNQAVKRPPTPVSPIRNVISIKTSAIHRVENQPRTFSLNLEVNNNDGFQRHIPVPLLPTARPQVGLQQKKRLLEIPDEDFEVPPPPPAAAAAAVEAEEDLEVKAKEETVVVHDSSSVLKSLLMDRIPRKRPLSPPKTSESGSSPKRPSICSDSSDILRRRLLGLNNNNNNNLPEAESALLLNKPKFQPPSATITSQQLEGQSPVDLRKEDLLDNTSKKQTKSYTQTSVLKHLLYRYTNAASEDH